MGFYITVHIILGVLAGASGTLVKRAQVSPASVPAWVSRSPYAGLCSSIASLSAIAAVITTFVQFGLVWGLATVGELVVGAVIVGMMPISLRAIAMMLAPPVCVVIMGALCGSGTSDCPPASVFCALLIG